MVLDNASIEDDSSPQAQNAPSEPQSAPQRLAVPSISHLVYRPELAVRPSIFSRTLNPLESFIWKQEAAQLAVQRADGVWAVEGRPITQPEFDAFVTADTQKLYYGNLGKPVGFGLTTALLYYRARSKLPPGMTMTDNFRFLRVLPKQELMRSLFSTGFKLLFGTAATTIGFSVFGSYMFLNTLLHDPRLRDIAYQGKEADKGSRLEGVRRRKEYLTNVNATVPKRHQQHKKRIVECLSTGVGPVTLGESKDSYSPDAEYQNEYTQFQESSYPSTSEQKDPAPETSVPQQNSGSDFFSSDDDASPTAQEFRGTSINSSGSSGGSVWDRIRQQNKPQRPAAQPKWPENAPSNGQDRYESERSREKEQAQVDFDRLVEAERNASDDASPQKGWGS